jgi:hypothetical protein
MKMDTQELKHYIIENLIKYEDPDDLILDICNKEGMTWPQAQTLIDQVRSENSSSITRKQAPFLTILAFITFFAGSVILGLEAYTVIGTINTFISLGQNPLEIFALLLYVAHSAPAALGLLPLGLAMVLGSLIGMSDVWKAILFPEPD